MPNLNFDAKSLMQSQRGNDCKVIAIGAVLNWLHENKKIAQAPLPARFRHEKNEKAKPQDGHLYSLRQVAKQKLVEKHGGEVKNLVTESIDDPEILAQVARHHSEVTADFIHCKSEAHYLHIIKAAIDQGLSPIVFFDVNPRSHQPGIFAGTHDHAAIVIGYGEYWWSGRTFFTLAQWRDETEVDGSALFHSSSQLRQAQQIESYYKYPHRTDEAGRGWIPVSQITNPKLSFLRDKERFKEAKAVQPGEAQPDLEAYYPKREARASGNNHGGLRRKILLIGSKQHHEKIIAGLKALKPEAIPHPTLGTIFLGKRGRDLLYLIGLCCLYAISHSATTLILKTTVLGLSAFTASWVLLIAIVALAIILMAAAHCRRDKTGLPGITPEFQPMRISNPQRSQQYSPYHQQKVSLHASTITPHPLASTKCS